MALGAGSRFGSYEILSVIGEGGMGRVYRARDLKLQRIVAVKVCPKAWRAIPSASRGSSVKPAHWRRSIIPTSRKSTASKTQAAATRC